MFLAFFLRFSKQKIDSEELFGIQLGTRLREEFIDWNRAFVYDIFFSDLRYLSPANDTGGSAIFGSRKGLKLAVDRCIFENCSSTGSGGAIYFKSTSSGTSHVCCTFAHLCDSGEMSGNFAFIYTDGFNENVFNLSSVSYSGHGITAKGVSPISIHGSSSVGYVNSSMNDCFSNSGIESRVYTMIIFSIFIDNAATDAHSVMLDGSGHLKSCNIMKNFQLNTVNGVIVATGSGDFSLSDCYIAENVNGLSIEFGTCKLTLTNCFIDKFTSDGDVDFVQAENLKENQITFFVNNSDILDRSYRTSYTKPKKPHIPPPAASDKTDRRNKFREIAMFVFLFIAVFCAGLTALFQSYEDEMPEDEPLLKGKKKRQNLSAMNAIV